MVKKAPVSNKIKSRSRLLTRSRFLKAPLPVLPLYKSGMYEDIDPVASVPVPTITDPTIEVQASIDALGAGAHLDHGSASSFIMGMHLHHSETAFWEECQVQSKISTRQVWETQLSDDVFLQLAAITAPARIEPVIGRNSTIEQLDDVEGEGEADCSGPRGCRVTGLHAMGDDLRKIWSCLKCVLTKLIQIPSSPEG
jgi:hypothetical protein